MLQTIAVRSVNYKAGHEIKMRQLPLAALV